MILITDSDKARRDTVAEMFYYMGILARSVKPEDVMREIGCKYSALLFTSVDFRGAPELAAAVRELGMATVAAITDQPSDDFELTFPRGTYSASIVAKVSTYRAMKGLHPLGRYECMGIDASADRHSPTYLGEPLPLTRTEAMILRCLIINYPDALTPSDVLKYAFRGSRTPELSSVRTHISIMNKKFRAATGHALTEAAGKTGYKLYAAHTAVTV